MCCGWVQRSFGSLLLPLASTKAFEILPLSCAHREVDSHIRLSMMDPFWMPPLTLRLQVFSLELIAPLLIPRESQAKKQEKRKMRDKKIGFFSSLTRTKLSRIDDEEMKRYTKWPKQEAWNHLSLLLTRRLTWAANPRWMNEASELIRFFLGNLLLFVGNFFFRTLYDKCCICWRSFVHSHPIISVSSSLVLVGLSAVFPTPLSSPAALLSCTFFGKVYRLTWT